MFHCLTSATGLANFGLFVGAALIIIALFTFLYIKFTPYDEMAEIYEGNSAAAASLSGAVLGFALPLYSVMASTTDIFDLLIWAAIALVVQFVVFYIIRMLCPRIVDGVMSGQVSSGVFLGTAALVVGIITAGAVTF